MYLLIHDCFVQDPGFDHCSNQSLRSDLLNFEMTFKEPLYLLVFILCR